MRSATAEDRRCRPFRLPDNPTRGRVLLDLPAQCLHNGSRKELSTLAIDKLLSHHHTLSTNGVPVGHSSRETKYQRKMLLCSHRSLSHILPTCDRLTKLNQLLHQRNRNQHKQPSTFYPPHSTSPYNPATMHRSPLRPSLQTRRKTLSSPLSPKPFSPKSTPPSRNTPQPYPPYNRNTPPSSPPRQICKPRWTP